MTREEHLLTILAEECSEVAQRCSKALRFGLDEVQPGQTLNNCERINQELSDLMTVVHMLNLPTPAPSLQKGDKIKKFFELSLRVGTLDA